MPDDPDPVQYSPEGVDLTLIRWFLTLTPDERLECVQQAVNSLQELRDTMSDG